MSDIDTDDNGTVKTLRERGDKAEARVRELEAQVKTLSVKVRQAEFGPVLKGRGVPDGVASLIPEGATDVAAVNAWLDGLGFPQAAPAQPEAPVAEVAPTTRPSIDGDAARNLAAIQRVEAGGIHDAPVGEDAVIARMNELKNDPGMSFDKLVQMLNAGQL